MENRLNFRVSQSLHDQIENEAKENGIGISSMIRMILSQRYGAGATNEPPTPPRQNKITKRPQTSINSNVFYTDENGLRRRHKKAPN